MKKSLTRNARDLIGRVCDTDRHPLLEDLKAAREFLAECGAAAIERAVGVDPSGAWGSMVKRVSAQLPAERPRLVCADVATHSLIELINQCATLDRLIDAIEWSVSALPEFGRVCICHPTTSSSKQSDGADNDLILMDARGRRCRFEVSDVASEKDGNRKEERDLMSLGVLLPGRGEERLKVQWPVDRLFLVVSTEFARGVMKRKPLWIRMNHVLYQKHDAGAETQVLEVLRGE
jgi:hypothetical protein